MHHLDNGDRSCQASVSDNVHEILDPACICISVSQLQLHVLAWSVRVRHHTARCNVVLPPPILTPVIFGSESRRPRLSDTDQSSLPKVHSRPTSALSGEKSPLGSASCIRTLARSFARSHAHVALSARQCKLEAPQALRRGLAPREQEWVTRERRIAEGLAFCASLRKLVRHREIWQRKAFCPPPSPSHLGFDSSSTKYRTAHCTEARRPH